MIVLRGNTEQILIHRNTARYPKHGAARGSPGTAVERKKRCWSAWRWRRGGGGPRGEWDRQQPAAGEEGGHREAAMEEPPAMCRPGLAPHMAAKRTTPLLPTSHPCSTKPDGKKGKRRKKRTGRCHAERGQRWMDSWRI